MARCVCRLRTLLRLRGMMQLQTPTISPSPPPLTRSLITNMRRSALKETLLRALRSQTSLLLSSHRPPTSPPEPHFTSFAIDPRVGERYVRLTRSYSDQGEQIQIDATMVDGSAPPGTGTNSRFHITVSVVVSRNDLRTDGITMQFLCSAWPDAMDVERVFVASPQTDAIEPYLGPQFKNLDDEVKRAVHDYLEERGVNDELAAFLHKYMANKDRAEHIRWLQNIESYVKK